MLIRFVFLFVNTTVLHCFFLTRTYSLKGFAQSVFTLAGDIKFSDVFIFVCTRTIRSSYMCDD